MTSYSSTSCRLHEKSDRKSTRLNSSHVRNSYAVFCLKKKNLDTIALCPALQERLKNAKLVSDVEATGNFSYAFVFFFFNDTASPEIYTLSLHDALPICRPAIASTMPRSSYCQHGPCSDGKAVRG